MFCFNLLTQILFFIAAAFTDGVFLSFIESVVYLIFIIVAVWLLTRLRSRYSIKSSHYLSIKVTQQISELCKKPNPFWNSLWDQIYVPSIKSLIAIGVTLVPFFVLSHLTKLNLKINNLDFLQDNHYQNLIAIHAGIGAIIFALLIFVAESLRDDGNKDRARVLLRESLLFPLTVAEIIVFLNFIWGSVNIFSVIPIFIVAAVAIVALWRLFSVLLNKSIFSKKRLQLLKDRLQQSINLALQERFGNNILLESLGENKIELDFNPWSIRDTEKDYHCFYAQRTGIVKDVRLDRLNTFAKLVEKEANKNGFSFYKEKVKSVAPTPDGNIATTEEIQTKYTHCDRQYLLKKFRDEIDEENKILLCVDKRTVSDVLVLSKLQSLAEEIFVIGRGDNFSEEVNLELADLEDQFITYIQEKKLGKIEESAKTYIALAESFLEFINSCGGGYTYEQASKERKTLFGGWNEIRWIEESVRDLYIKASQSHDQDIIGHVAFIPVAIAIRAIKHGDQYLYQEFLKFPPYLYSLALRETSSDVKKFMVERSWVHLKEMSQFYIEGELDRRAKDQDSLQRYKEFAIPVFAAFQSLLKTAFDKRQIVDFQDFLRELLALYKRFDPENDHPNSEYLEAALKWAKSEEERQELKRSIAFLKAKEEAAKDIRLKKYQVIFGVTAWILDKYWEHKDDEQIAEFFRTAEQKLPSELDELSEIYSSARTFETEDLWGWDDWELIADGQVHHIDVHSKLDRLFVVKALRILKNKTPEQIANLSLKPSRELAFLIEEQSGNLAQVLNNVAQNGTTWSFILDEAAQQQISNLRELIKKAKAAQEDQEADFLKSVEIDPEKLAEFKGNIVDEFFENVHLRPLAKKLGIYNELFNQTPGFKIASFGYNQIEDKAAFIKNWHVHYGGWGEQYGQGMAHSEDQIVFGAITEGLSKNKLIAKNDIIPEIHSVITGHNFSDPIILQTLQHIYEFEEIKRSDKFIANYRVDCPKTGFENIRGYMGVIMLEKLAIPVMDIFVGKKYLHNKVIILDSKDFGVWNQYPAVDKPEDAAFQEGVFYMRIADLNKDNELRQKIIAENSSWLQQHEDKEGYLRQKALVSLYEKFEFKVIKPDNGCILSVHE